ncbi:MAG: Mur ligase family protein, partial [Gemmatimonadales bacterium]
MTFERWRATGREIAVLGLAKSGIAATRLLRKHGLPVYASDAAGGAELEAPAAPLRASGAAVELAGHDLARITRAAAVVVSPGVPPDAPPLRAAREAGVEVSSEVDVGWAAMTGVRYAVITGTNGKTTTTALAGHLLSACGVRAVTAGNIGRPLSEVALETPSPEWVALEISSFQLHDTHYLVPDVGVLTNLAPDHLDRYPSLADYYADKARLFLRAGPGSYWVTNADDPETQRLAAGASGSQAQFSVRGPATAWYDRAAQTLK